MMISTKGRYALRTLIDMAEHQAQGYIPLKDIASRQDISEKYLESIVKALVKEKVLVGLRGKGGGYKLSKSPDEFTVFEILDIMEGSLAPVTCLGKDAEPCPKMLNCRTIEMWRGLYENIKKYLSNYTIKDLMGEDNSFDYVI